jgi:cell division protein FtsL
MITYKGLISLTGMTLSYFNIGKRVRPIFEAIGLIVFIWYIITMLSTLYTRIIKRTDLNYQYHNLDPIIDKRNLTRYATIMHKAYKQKDMDLYYNMRDNLVAKSKLINSYVYRKA